MAHTKLKVTYGTHLVVWTSDIMEDFLVKIDCRFAKRSYILSAGRLIFFRWSPYPNGARGNGIITDFLIEWKDPGERTKEHKDLGSREGKERKGRQVELWGSPASALQDGMARSPAAGRGWLSRALSESSLGNCPWLKGASQGSNSTQIGVTLPDPLWTSPKGCFCLAAPCGVGQSLCFNWTLLFLSRPVSLTLPVVVPRKDPECSSLSQSLLPELKDREGTGKKGKQKEGARTQRRENFCPWTAMLQFLGDSGELDNMTPNRRKSLYILLDPLDCFPS